MKLDEFVNYLTKLFADEVLASTQYLLGYFRLKDFDKKREFLQHAIEEFHHGVLLSKWIEFFDNKKVITSVNFDVNVICGFKFPMGSENNIVNDSVNAEKCAVRSYVKAITYLKKITPEIVRIFGKSGKDIFSELLETLGTILKDELEHIDDMEKLL